MAENDKNKKDLEEEKKQERNEQESELEKKQERNEQESELEKMLKRVEEQFGIDRSQVRVVRVNTPPRNIKSIIVDCVFNIFLNLVLILSISGFFEWYDDNGNIFNLVWFGISFSIIELLIKYFITFAFPKTVMKTFGMIIALSPLLAIPLVLILTEFVEVKDIYRFLLMFFILLVVRTMIKSFFMKQKLRKYLNRRGK